MTLAGADSECASSPMAEAGAAESGRAAVGGGAGGGIKLAAIAAAVGGRIADDSDGGFVVARLGGLENAAADALAFCADAKHAAQLKTCAAGAVIARAEHAELFPRHKIIAADPYLAYARASVLFAPPPEPSGVHPTAVIAESAEVHADATLGAYSVIGANTRIKKGAAVGSQVSIGRDCVIGAGSVIDSGVHIYANTRIGKSCRIAAGAVIGAAGFGYAQTQTDEWTRIEQLGGVVIGDEVDIGANTAIDRGALGDTVIGDRVKLDNHIQIAHNVRVGRDTIMAGCVAVAGSAVIGARCQFGGRASVLGHLTIADDARIGACSVVAKSITDAGVYSSLLPAQPVAKWRRVLAHLRRLERLAAQVKGLKP